jgi:putative DNA primase/helicase
MSISNPVDRVVAALEAHRFHPKANGKGWMALCPAHDDHDPSLSVCEGDDGRVLVHCHAGCDTSEVLSSLGLRTSDLFVDSGDGGDELAHDPQAKGKPTAQYDYTDAGGNLVFQVVRHEPKGFRQRRPDGKGGWIYSTKDIKPKPLYNQPAVLNADLVLVTEGEKDADTLNGLGFFATTSAGGSGSAAKTDWSPLNGRRVVLIPDNDEPGAKYRDEVGALLADTAAEVRSIDPLPWGSKEDVTDWLSDGRTPDDLAKLIGDAPMWKPRVSSGRLVGVRLSDVDVTRPVEWLWHGRIPRNGALSIFDGAPDVGKSTVMSDLVARVTTGRSMPDGSCGLSGGVVIVTSESAQQVIARQIEVAGGDRARVQLVATVGEGIEERPISLPDDLHLLRPALTEVGAVALILDPLLEVIGGGRSDSYKDGDVRRGLTPVRRLCEDENLALIGVRHPTKGVGGLAMYKGGGSVAFVAVARSAFYVARDPGDPDLRVIASTKCNLGPRPRSVAYRLEVVRDLQGIEGAEGDLGVCRVEWVGHIDRSAQELADSPETLSPEQRGVVNALAEGCTTIGEVAAYTDRGYTACSNNLGRLVQLKHVRKVKTGKYELTGSLAEPTIIPFTAPYTPPIKHVSTVKPLKEGESLQGLQGGCFTGGPTDDPPLPGPRPDAEVSVDLAGGRVDTRTR